MEKTLETFQKLMQIKGYSKSTINTYISCLLIFKNTGVEQWEVLEDEQLIQKCFELFQQKQMSYSYQKQMIGALQLFYLVTFDRKVPLEILRNTRKSFKLPVVFSKEEVIQLLTSVSNLKHKAILTTIYSLGLRAGELATLKVSHLDGKRGTITLYSAKGKKDRQVMFPENLKWILREYYKKYKPKEYLFEGSTGGQYSKSSMRRILVRALGKSNISKKATLHTLRHSFATHLLEEGTDVRIIQKLLGHTSIKTTMIYTHVANTQLIDVKSPIDTFDFE